MSEKRARGYLIPDDIAQALDVTAPTVLKWIKDGHLVGYSLPSSGNRRYYRVLIEELVAFCKRNDVPLNTVCVGNESLADLVGEEAA